MPAALAVAVFLCAPGAVRSQTQPPLHVLKITAGPAGTESNGTFVLSEERSAFDRSVDREVIVLFQWEGLPGPHKLAARWRSPDGSLTSESVIDYVAKDRRFGAYWQIAITPTMALGMWSIEATVDGQPAGRLNFDVTDRPVAPGAIPKRALSPGELYERLSKSYVLLSRTAVNGGELEAAGGVLRGTEILTAVAALDEMQQLHAHLPGGARQELTQIVDMHRQTGWAILPSPTAAAENLPAASDVPKIGSRCYSMDGNAAGARVLLEGQVTGIAAASTGGLIVSFFNGAGTMGAPVVNEYGELLGVLGGTAMPRPGTLRMTATVVEFGNIRMVPIDAIAARAAAVPSSFDTARSRGDLLEPLAGAAHVLSGGFATNVTRAPMVEMESQRREFSTREKEFVVFVTLSPRERLRGETSFRLYNESNQVVAHSDPRKINYRANELVLSSWRVPVFQSPGMYRAELLIDGKPAWRDYVRIVK